MQAMSDEQRRFRVLAGMSRARLLSHLRRTRRALGVRELADAVGLHPNTVRGHLDQMVETGLIDRVRAEPSGRGRPAFRYAASPGAQQDDASAYRALAAAP